MSRIRESARGEDCQVRISGVCNNDTATTIWAHLGGVNYKGIGQKSLDILGAYACFACHNVIDRRVQAPHHMTRQDVESDFAQGHYRSLVILDKKGLI